MGAIEGTRDNKPDWLFDWSISTIVSSLDKATGIGLYKPVDPVLVTK